MKHTPSHRRSRACGSFSTQRDALFVLALVALLTLVGVMAAFSPADAALDARSGVRLSVASARTSSRRSLIKLQPLALPSSASSSVSAAGSSATLPVSSPQARSEASSHISASVRSVPASASTASTNRLPVPKHEDVTKRPAPPSSPANSSVPSSVSSRASASSPSSLSSASSPSSLPFTKLYDDLWSDTETYRAVVYLVQHKIFVPTKEKLFLPKSYLTRAELAQWIMTAKDGYVPDEPIATRITDIAPTHPYYKYVVRADAQNIVDVHHQGYINSLPVVFLPEEPVSRATFLDWIYKAFDDRLPKEVPFSFPNDRYMNACGGYWVRPLIGLAQALEMFPFKDGTASESGWLKHDEAAIAFRNLLQYLEGTRKLHIPSGASYPKEPCPRPSSSSYGGYPYPYYPYASSQPSSAPRPSSSSAAAAWQKKAAPSSRSASSSRR